jgi:hypothetical protein
VPPPIFGQPPAVAPGALPQPPGPLPAMGQAAGGNGPYGVAPPPAGAGQGGG